ncbi:amidase family protein [Dyella sp. C11]|uniref:amidase family protein n=1 Tax=Dyella sp. C11 TaxID=2126991 RepID=UPI000D654375|nr:amidase family protein [Dyella sp. C11]
MSDVIASTDVSSPSASGANDLIRLGLVEAANAIRRGDVTSEAYTSALLQRAREKVDLNSFISIDEVGVLAAARDADKSRAKGATAPLLGVPIGVKDSYLTKGLATSFGLSSLQHFVSEEDADTVRAMSYRHLCGNCAKA